MLRTSSQSLLRSFTYRAASKSFSAPRRYLSSTNTRYGSQSWGSTVARWALAGGAVYYYNTSDVFAEEPAVEDGKVQSLSDRIEGMPTIDQAVEERRKRAEVEAASRTSTQKSPSAQTSENATATDVLEGGSTEKPVSAEEIEEEAEGEGAFNPETGEINWDCPCLGGMAHGPCGEEFKAAFSCFVYSEQEPKGMDCIDRFKNMQNCFRQHPDVYGEDLDGEEADEADEAETVQESSVTDASRTELANDKPSLSASESSVRKLPTNQMETSNDRKPAVATE